MADTARKRAKSARVPEKMSKISENVPKIPGTFRNSGIAQIAETTLRSFPSLPMHRSQAAEERTRRLAKTQRARPGRAVQADPIKPTLKAPGTMRLKLKCGNLASIFAFNFNLRRYAWAWTPPRPTTKSCTPR